MSAKDPTLFLRDMLETARRVRSKVDGVSKAEFDVDENLRLALTHLLQIIGEAAFRTPADLRAQIPDLPWPAVVSMRHRLVHDYGRVDEDIIWRTATTRMHELIEQLEQYFQNTSGKPQS